MEVYVVQTIIDEEYGGFEITFITANEQKAIEYCKKHNYKFKHWSGAEYDSVYYTEIEVEDCD